MLTQYDDARFKQAAQQAGAWGYMLKTDLLAVRRLLGGGK